MRTISKALLKEFIEYEARNPNSDSQTARRVLCGKSDIDKFEYGYNATLWTLVKLNKTLPNRSSDNFTSQNNTLLGPLQQIFYGAPGTGKSHDIEKMTKGHSVIRTTFHPDSDYSTFVGSYKPTMETRVHKVRENLSIQDLADTLKSYYDDNDLGKIGGIQKFVFDYISYLNGDITITNIPELLNLAGLSNNYKEEFSKYIKFCKLIPKQTESKIVYKFVKQAFLKAYLSAWKKYAEGGMTHMPSVEPQFLVIEEINRGNCAQIFGDIFQLLDRGKNLFSCYPIEVDTDLQQEIANAFANEEEYKLPNELNVDDAISNYTSNYGETLTEDIRKGRVMLLPPNLYIWATMNTSDQSLFPIDSAFKRRWCMKYVPINPEKENWAIEVDSRLFSWTSFLKKINFEISETTKSEDKKLGFYFCKADKKAKDSDDEPTIITLENFTSKVLFYIYNDVFKDYGHEREFFKDKENGQKKIEFENFYDYNGEIKAESVEKLLVNLDVDVFDNSEADDNEEQDEDTNNSHHNYLKSVTFDDEVFSSDELKKFDVYIKSLQKIGLDKVVPIIEKSKYKRLNCPLASKQQYDAISQSKSFSYVEIDGYQFVKGVSADTLINILNEIKSVLNLSFSIQIYN